MNCAYCGGPGGFLRNGGHSLYCERFDAPRKDLRNMLKNPLLSLKDKAEIERLLSRKPYAR